MKLSGWGRYPVVSAPVRVPRDEGQLAKALAAGGVIARGNGRAYGDSAISRGATIDMRRFNRMISFDPATAILIAEAGVLLADIITSFLPRGWFPLVTPGTKFVTLGGMVAADVHGKNHHREGSMMSAVEWLDVMDAQGRIHRASRKKNTALFEWSFGTMGLVGIILRVGLRLRPVETGWIRQTLIPAPDLNTAMEVFEDNDDSLYSVAWIDCLSTGAATGRSLVMLGEHAGDQELTRKERKDRYAQSARRKLRFPITAPGFLISGPTVKAFNALYYRNGLAKHGERLVDWDSYFYPLDAISDWNKIYGRRGFLQFQCVLPLESSKPGLNALLGTIAAAGTGSFLAVLKRFGEQTSRFSFPMLGYTLALDFPATQKAFALLNKLDAITLAHGGRFYLAKDARMTAQTFRASDTRVTDFIARRSETDATTAFRSFQSERLDL